MLNIIAAIGKNRELGKHNKLLWHIPGELPRFKQLTSGHPIIMGRKTYESIGKLLPDRTNIVLTSKQLIVNSKLQDIIFTNSVSHSLEIAKQSPGNDEIFVIGGAKVYEQFIDIADRLFLTLIDMSNPTADAYFPPYSAFRSVVSKEAHLEEAIPYTYLTLEHPVLTPGVDCD